MAPLNPALTFLNSIHYHTADEANDASKVCMDHDHEKLRPQLISTWMPNGVGAMPGKRVIFAETQVGGQAVGCGEVGEVGKVPLIYHLL